MVPELSIDRQVSRHRYYAVWMLSIVYLFNHVDRQIFAVLQHPIKLAFDLSDTQLGLIGGTAFALFYATLGIPIARIADRSHRINIVAMSLAVWSLFTTLTGFVQNFAQLIAARLIVGVGEAGCSPPSYSVISDYFEPQRRATALAIYSLGVSGGSVVALIVAPMIAQAYGWRAAFFAVGLPGILLAFVLKFTVREPSRSQVTQEHHQMPFVAALAQLWKQRAFRYLLIGVSIYTVAANGIGAFYSLFMIRTQHMTLTEAGRWLALASVLGGLAGTFMGGKIADVMANRNRDDRWQLWTPAIALAINIPVGLCLFSLESKPIVIVLLIINIAVSGAFIAPTVAMTQLLANASQRAFAAAVLFTAMNFVGLGLGPPLLGYLSDYFQAHLTERGLDAASASADGLRYAFMSILVAPAIAVAFYLRAASHIALRGSVAAVA